MIPCIYREKSYIARNGTTQKVGLVIVRSYLAQLDKCEGNICYIKLVTGKNKVVKRNELEAITTKHYNRLQEQWYRADRLSLATHPEIYSNSGGGIGRVPRLNKWR